MKTLNQEPIPGKLYKAYEIVYPYDPNYHNDEKQLVIPATILIGNDIEDKWIHFPENESLMYIQKEVWRNDKFGKVDIHKVLWKNVVGYMTEHTIFEEVTKNEAYKHRRS